MFWKLYNSLTHHFEYHAIVSMEVDLHADANALYGQKHYIVTLANGTKERHTFEPADWAKFSASYKKNGFVLNEP